MRRPLTISLLLLLFAFSVSLSVFHPQSLTLSCPSPPPHPPSLRLLLSTSILTTSHPRPYIRCHLHLYVATEFLKSSAIHISLMGTLTVSIAPSKTTDPVPSAQVINLFIYFAITFRADRGKRKIPIVRQRAFPGEPLALTLYLWSQLAPTYRTFSRTLFQSYRHFLF